MTDTGLPTIAALKAEAESIGITKTEELRTYIKERQDILREERAAERCKAAEERRATAEAEERSANERQAVREAEERKMIREAEAAAAAAQAAEREATRQHELAILSARSLVTEAEPLSNTIQPLPHAVPRLPSYKEGDDITEYLIMFESVAELLHINREKWALHLAPLLVGKASKIFIRLDAAARANYEKLKEELLKGFGHTADTYNKDFRSLRPKSDDTGRQFAVNLGRLLDLWIGAGKINQDY